MKSISLLSSLTRWGWLRKATVWLLGTLILTISLSACGNQSARPLPTEAPLAATLVPDTIPDSVPVETNESPATPVAAQITTGFNISGWV